MSRSAAAVLAAFALVAALVPAVAAQSRQVGTVVVANGWSAADSSVASALAALESNSRSSAVVLYANSDELTSRTAAFIRERRPSRVILVGGTVALEPRVEAEVERLLGGTAPTRIDGRDRFDTAAKAVPADATTFIVANGYSAADTGVAAALAAVNSDAAVLLATKDSLTEATERAIRERQPKRVEFVGGTAVLAAALADRVRDLVPSITSVPRHSGASRTETAADAVPAGTTTLVIANGWSAADTGVAAALAAITPSAAVLYAESRRLTTPSEARIASLQPRSVVLVGGSAALDARLHREIHCLAPAAEIRRLSGIDRIDTAVRAAAGSFTHVSTDFTCGTGGGGGGGGSGGGGIGGGGTPPPAVKSGPPSGLTVIAQHEHLALSWTAPQTNAHAVSSYEVQYCDTANASCDDDADWSTRSTGSRGTSFEITGLTNGTTYQTRVRAVASAGESEWSPSEQGTPAQQPPDAPTIQQSTLKSDGLAVTWAQGASNGGSAVTGYDVRYRVQQSNSTWPTTWTEHTHTGTTTSTTIYGITSASLSQGAALGQAAPASPGIASVTAAATSKYQVQVRAENTIGTGPWSAQPPDAPPKPTVDSLNQSLSVQWAMATENGSPITDYDVQYRACTATDKTCVSNPSWGAWTSKAHSGVGTTATVTGLTNGTAYEVRVRAKSTKGAGDWSASGLGTPAAQKPDAPDVPTLTPKSQSLEASWTAPAANDPSGITDYDVRYRKKDTNTTAPGDQPGAWTSLTGNADPGTNTTATVGGLTNGTAYQVQVRATNSAGTGEWSLLSNGTPTAGSPSTQPPDPPSAPMLQPMHQGLGVSWLPPAINGSAITGYGVRYRVKDTNTTTPGDQPGSWQAHSHSSTDTTAIIASLPNGTTYQVQVRATSAAGNSSWSASKDGTPAAQVPDAPAAPSLTSTNRELGVSWTAPALNGAPITDYDVRYRACTATDKTCTASPSWGSWTTLTGNADPGTKTSAAIDSLTNGTAYQVQVQAANSGGDSDWSSSTSGIPAKAPAAPPAPTLGVLDVSLAVSWTGPATNGAPITDYDVQYRACTATPKICTTNPTWGNWRSLTGSADPRTSTSATISNLTNGTAYQVQVRAANRAGQSGWSNSASAVPARVPYAPSMPTLVVWNAELRVSWTKPSGNIGSAITDYDVRYRVKDTDTTTPGDQPGSWTELDDSGDNATDTSLSATIGGLTNDTAYQVQVRAGNSIGDGDWSASRKATPTAQKPAAPAAPSLAGTDRDLAVSWTAPAHNGSPINDYDVRYRPCTAADKTCTTGPSWGNWTEWNSGDTSTNTSATVTGLTNGTAYQVQVRATNGKGDSGWSTEASEVPSTVPGAPAAPTLTVAHVSLGVTWAAPASNGGSPINDYDVRYCDNSTGCDADSEWTEWNSANTSTDTSATITGLTNGTTYQVQVRAANSNGDGTWSSSASAVPAKAPDAPSAPTLVVWNKELRVSWTAPAHNGAAINDYDVRYCKNSTGCDAVGEWTEWNSANTSTDTSATITGLTNGTAYQVQVRATNSVGDSAWSNSASGTPAAQAPDAPAAPTLTYGDQSLGASWGAPANNGAAIDDYDVRYCDNSTGCDAPSEWTALPDNTNSTTRSADIGSLVNGTTYQVQVRAGNSVGDGAWSASATEYPSTAPDAPAKPSLTVQHQALGVSWSAPSGTGGSAVTDYDVRYSPCTATDKTCATNPSWGNWTEWNSASTSTDTSATITGLTNGTAYQVQVRAGNRSGDGSWSASETATPAKVPATPTAPSLTVQHQALDLSWTAPADNGSAITDYNVQYRACTASCTTNNPTWDTDWTSHSHTGTGTTATIASLTNGTKYQVQVQATNGVGSSAWSAAAEASPAPQPPNAPGAPTLTVGNGSLGVSWTAPGTNGSAITGYKVNYRVKDTNQNQAGDQPGAWQNHAHAGTGTTATIASLTNDTSYEVRVLATSNAGDGGWSPLAQAAPGAQPPGAPGTPTLTAKHQGLGVKWTASATNGAPVTDYDVRYRPCTATDGDNTVLTCATNPTWHSSWTSLDDTGDNSHDESLTASITGLTNGTAYQVQVKADSAAGTSGWSASAQQVPAIQAPDAPGEPDLTAKHQGLRVEWDEPKANGANIDDYDVRYCVNSTGCDAASEWTALADNSKSTVRSATITGLTNGTKYQVQVRAGNSVGDGAWSTSSTSTPAVQAPDAPHAPTVVVWNAELRVSWTAPAANGSTITDYDVRYCTNSTGCDAASEWTEWNAANTSTTRSATITGLTNGTAYQVQVRATNGVGDSTWSASTTATPAAQKPGVPTNVTLTKGATQLGVSWTAAAANGDSIDDYDVQYRACTKRSDLTCSGSTSNSDWGSWAEWNSGNTSTTRSATITGLTNGTAYQVQVRATNGVGDSPWSASATAAPEDRPAAPAAPTLTYKHQGLDVSWGAPADNGHAITDYDVRYCVNSTGCDAASEWTALDDTGNNGTNTTRSASITGLTNGTTYQVQVRAGNSLGDGPWSPSATEKPSSAPGVPTNLNLTVADVSLGVSWHAPTNDGGGIDDYDVRYCIDSTGCDAPGEWTALPDITDSTTRSASITGLTNGTEYQVQVRSQNRSGTSAWTASAKATPAKAPDAPAAPTVTPAHQGLGVTWAVPSNDNGAAVDDYDVRYRACTNSADLTCATNPAWSDSWTSLDDTGNNGSNTTRSASISGLTNGTAYQVQVRAENSAGDGAWSTATAGTPAIQKPDTPTAPTVTPKHLALGVSWTAPASNGADIGDYDVQYRACSSGCSTATPTWPSNWTDRTGETAADTDTEITVSGLANGTKYQARVRAANSVGESGWSQPSLVGSPAKQPPDAPSAPTVTVWNKSLNVSWTAPAANGSPITDYDVRYCTDSTGCDADDEWSALNDTGSNATDTTTSATITGLTNGTEYQVQVRAGNGVGDGKWSLSANATPAAQKPGVPTLNALTYSDQTLGASWTAPANNGSTITDYDVRYCDNSTGCTSASHWTALDDTGSNATDTALSDSIGSLTNGTTYQVQVRAGNGVGDGAWSASKSEYPSTTPGVPTNLALTVAGEGLGVSWDAPGSNGGAALSGYKVRYRVKDTDTTQTGDQPGNWQNHAHSGTGTTASIASLTNGTAYQVQVRATNRSGDSAWTASATQTPADEPDAPGAPTLAKLDERLDVSWAAPAANGADIDDYDVRYCVNSTGCTGPSHWTALPDNTKSTTRSASITGLTNGTTYQVQVRAGNSVGDGAWSASASAAPHDEPEAPAAPTLGHGNTSLSVSWAAPTDNGQSIDDYDVRYCDNSTGCDATGEWTALDDTGNNSRNTTRSASISGLTNGTTYRVQVRAENSVGDGPWSPSATEYPSTKPTAPAAPTVNVGNVSLAVSWSAPSSTGGSAVTDYDVRYCTDSTGCDAASEWTALDDTNSNGSDTSRSATISSLTNGTAYRVQVSAQNRDGNSPWSPSTTQTPAKAPETPGAPTVVAKHQGLGVSWAAPASNGDDIDDYDVQYRACASTDGDTNVLTCNGTTNLWTSTWTSLGDSGDNSHDESLGASISGLTNGTAYQVRVRAENGVGPSGWSDATTGTPATQKPDTPAAPTVVAKHLGLGVSWAAPAANGETITDYDVRRRACTKSADLTCTGSTSDSDWGSWTSLDDTGNNATDTTTSATVAGLTNGTAYQVQVRATNSNGDSGWSASGTGTPAKQAPDAPTAPTVTVWNKSLSVSWTAPAANGSTITDYDVRYCTHSTGCTAASHWTALNDTGSNATDTTTSATVAGLTNGTAYQVQVRAGNGVGDGAWSASTNATPTAQKPDAPAAPTLNYRNATYPTLSGKLRVSWAAPARDNGSTITDYDVRYCDNSTGCDAPGEWTALDDTGNNATDTTLNATIGSLTNGTTYQVQVRAGNGVGDGAWSASASEYPSTTPGVPRNLALDVDDEGLDADWDAPSSNGGDALSGYKVRYRVKDTDTTQTGDQPGTWQNHAHSGTGTTASIGSLTNGTAYQVQVRATNRSGDSAWTASATQTPADEPDAPGTLTLTHGNTTLTVQWTAPADNGDGIDDYDVQYRACTNASDLTCASSPTWATDWTDRTGETAADTATTVTLSNLTNGTAYQVQVRAENGEGESGWSPTASEYPSTTPGVPTSLGLTVADEGLGVSWTAPTDNGGAALTDYDVRHCIDTTGCDAASEWTALDDTGSNATDTSTTATISSLVNGTAYQVQVRAQNRSGTSAWTASATKTPADEPDTPGAPTVTVWNKSLNVSWAAPADNGASITDYDIQYRACTNTDGDNNVLTCANRPTWGGWQPHSHTGAATKATISNLTNGTAYQVRVQATNSVGDSSWSLASARATPAAQKPSTPAAPAVTVKHQSLDVSWTAPADNGASITDYDIQYRACTSTDGDATDKACDGTTNQWGSWNDHSHTGTTTKATISSLTNGTAYQVQVQATNSVGDSSWSASSANATPATQAPDAPGAPTLTVKHQRLNVSWTAPNANGAAINDYDIQYRACTKNSDLTCSGVTSDSDWGSWNDHSHTGAGTTASIDRLTNGTAYQVQVQATNSVGDSSWSDAASAIPAPQPPSTPAAPTLTVKHQKLDVSWTAPATNGSTITGYSVQYRVKDTDETTAGDQPGAWQSHAHSGTGTTATIGSLTNGTEYQVQVQATSAAGTSGWSDSASATPSTVPGLPVLTLSGVPGQPNQTRLTWTVPDDGGSPITGYVIDYRCHTGDGWASNPGGVSPWTVSAGTTTRDSSITECSSQLSTKEYRFRMWATNANGKGGTTAFVRTTKPSAVDATAITTTLSGTQMAVSWTAPADGGHETTDYDVRYRPCASTDGKANDKACNGTTNVWGSWVTLSGSDDPRKATSATISGLSASTVYQVQVQSTNARGSSAWSTSKAWPTVPTTSGTPTVSPRHAGLNVSWAAFAANGAAVTDYDVQYQACSSQCSTNSPNWPSNWTNRAGETATDTAVSLKLSGLTNGTPYRVRVRAANWVGESAWAMSAAATPATAPPDAPAAPTLGVASQTSLSVSWTAPTSEGASITDYDVRYRACTATPKSCTGSTADSDWGAWADRSGETGSDTTTSATLSGLAKGTAYQVQVRAANSVGEGGWSPSGTEIPAAVPSAPAAPTLTVKHQSLAASWTAPSSDGGSAVIDYDVQYQACSANCATNTPKWPGSWTNRTGETDADIDTAALISGLANGTKYRVRVRAANPAGEGPWSAASAAASPATVKPDVPRSFTVTARHQGLAVSWTAPVDSGLTITDYDVRYRACTATPKDCSGTEQWSGWTTLSGNADPGTSTSATVAGLTNGTKYQAQARATNSLGTGPWTASAATVPATQPPDAPAAPTVAYNNTRLDVSWSAPTSNGESITDYDVQYRACASTDGDATDKACNGTANMWDSSWIEHVHAGTSRSAALRSLTNGTAYQVRVRAANSKGTGYWSAPGEGTPAPAPAAPTDVAVTTGDQSFTMTWTVPSGPVDRYEVKYQKWTSSFGGTWVPFVPRSAFASGGGATTLTVSGFLNDIYNGQRRRAQVRAENKSGWGSASSWVEFHVIAPPPVPTDVSLTVKDKSLGVSWTSPTNNSGGAISDYDVQYRACFSTDGDTNDLTCDGTTNVWASSWAEWDPDTDSTTIGATITGLTNGTAYQVQARSTNSKHDSAWSASATATPAAKPAAPDAPTLTAKHTALGVSWTAPEANGAPISDYDVQYSDCTANCSTNTPTWGSWTEWNASDTGTTIGATITGLTNSTKYRVQVRATNSVGDSAWSASATATPAPQAPDAPASPSLVVWDAELRVSWTKPTENGATITDYDVQYRACTKSADLTCSGSTSDTDWGAWAEWNAADTSSTIGATITGLTNDTAYEVQVQATNSAGDSDWSAAAKATPTAQVPDAPSDPRISSYGNASLTVTWTAPADNGASITDYDVQYRPCSSTDGDATDKACDGTTNLWGNWSDHSFTGTGVTTTISSLTNGTAYEVQVRAVNSVGNGAWSDSSSSQYPSTVPAAPAAPTLGFGSSELTVTWAAPSSDGGADVSGYKVGRCSADCGTASNWTITTLTGTGTTTKLTGLNNGTAYQVRVAATNRSGDSAWSASTTETPAYKPGKPAAPTLTRGNAQVTVDWAAPANGGSAITDYNVNYQEEGKSTQSHSFTGAGLTTDITGLTNGKRYRAQVQAVNKAGSGAWSDWSSYATPATVPSAPSAPSLAFGNTQLTVTVTAPPDNGDAITDYDVQYRACTKSTDLLCSGSTNNSDWGNWTEWNSGNTSTNTTATITGLTNGTKYQVQARAANSVGDGAWSASASEHPSTAPGAPGAPTLTVKSASLDVSWSAPTDDGHSAVTDYDVRYRACANTNDLTCATNPSWGSWTEWNSGNTSTTRTATITGLTNDTKYEVQVRAANRSGDGTWSDSASASPTAQKPGTPAAPTLTVKHQSLDVSWTAAVPNGSPITDYDVQYRGCNATPKDCSGTPSWTGWTEWNASNTGTTRTATITGLTNGTKYEVQVRATNLRGDSAWSASTAATPATTAGKPTGVSVTAGATQLTVSWTAPSANGGAAITAYSVRRCDQSTGCDVDTEWTAHNSSGTGTTYTITGLTNGTTYRVQVAAVNSVGTGAWSTPYRTGKPKDKPDAPDGLALVSGNRSLAASWTAPADNGASITSYSVTWCGGTESDPGGGDPIQVDCYDDSKWKTKSASSTSATITGLSNGSSYQVKVRARNSVDWSEWSSEETGTPGAPAAPSWPSTGAVVDGDDQLTVDWNKPAFYNDAIIGYEVAYCTSSDDCTDDSNWTSQTVTDQVDPNDPDSEVVTVYTISGLSNGTAYTVRVRAENSRGSGGWSATRSGTPARVPDTPTGLTLTAKSRGIDVSWTLPTDTGTGGSAITGSKVQYRGCTATPKSCTGDNPTWSSWTTKSVSGSTTTYSITSLTNGTKYEVQVAAVNRIGTSTYTSASSATPAALPSKPTNVSAETKHQGLQVTWTAAAGNGSAITGYDVQYRACNKTGDLTCTGSPSWGAWTSHTHDGTGTSTSIGSLTNGTKYQVQVQAKSNAGVSGFTTAVSGTPAAVPDAPSAPSLTSANGQLDVSWTEPTDNGSSVTDYDVRHRKCTKSADLTCASDATWGTWKTLSGSDDPGTNTSVTIGSLTNGTAYQVQVRATNANGTGAWSAASKGTPAGPPARPADPTVTAGSDQLTVTWVAPSDNGSAITGYDVAHCTSTDDCTDDSGNWTDNSVSSDTLSYDITGLSNGTTYKVRVRAKNSPGDGPWSNTVNGTPVGKPDAPASVDVASGSGRLIVSWSTPTSNGATVNGFKLRYCNSTDDDCYDYANWSNAINVSGASTRTKTITGLTNDKLYDLEIATTSSDGGDSDWSTGWSGTPGGPNKITTFSVTAGSGQFTVSGTAPAKNSSDISYYEIAFCVDAPADDDSSDVCANDRWSTDSQYVNDPSQTSFSFDITNGVSSTTKYKVRIRAENNQGKGAWSATKSVTTT